MEMTNKEKRDKCKSFLRELKDVLSDAGYAQLRVGRRNNDIYLFPKGKRSEITYYGKPELSFRFSYHWNWYASTEQCSDPDYVQCNSMDMPRVRKREHAGWRSKPRYGYQIAIYGCDHWYHCVYGEKFNYLTNSWEWVENSVEDVISILDYWRYRSTVVAF